MISTTLAYFPSPAQGVWHLGPIPIRAYALFIIAGIIAALVIGDRRWAARGGERGVIYDIALWAVPFGLIGGRLYHVMTDWKTYFGPEGAGPIAALKIWDGGLGIWGAVALGGVGAWIGCKSRGIPLPAFGDAIAPGIVLAQAIGRLGNYFNQELYGRETTVPWGMEIFYRRDPSGILDVHSLTGVSTGQVAGVVHPTFLYELLCNLLVFVILLYVDRRFKIGHGRLFALYVAGYCVGRFWVELMRDDVATHIAGIRVNSFTSTFVFIGAIVYFILAPKGREDPATLGGKDEGDESVADELAKDLVAAAAATGVVAAATVAGREDEEPSGGAEPEPEPEPEPESAASDGEPEPVADAESPVAVVADETPEADPEAEAKESAEPAVSTNADAVADEATEAGAVVEAEPETSDAEAEVAETSEPAASTNDDAATPETESAPTDADDVETSPEDEAIVEAEVAAPDAPEVEVESAAVAEDADLIDEDRDPVDDEDLEGSDDAPVGGGPVSEQEEELAETDEAEDGGEAEAESEAELVKVETPEPEPSTNVDEVSGEAEAVDEAEDAPALSAAVSEQEEELEETDEDDESDAAAEAETETAGETSEPEPELPDDAADDEDHDPVVEGETEDVSAQDEQVEELEETGETTADDAEAEPAAEAEPEPEPASPVTPATTATTTDSGADTSARRSVWSRLRRR